MLYNFAPSAKKSKKNSNLCLAFAFAFLCLSRSNATSNSSDINPVFCTVCRILVTEANWSIGQIDPKKIIETGSFRVDPDGQQPYKKKKKYARSEGYLEELLEDICDKFRNYAELTTQPPLESKHIVRWQGFKKERLQNKDLKLDYDAGKNLIYKCNDFLEEHFDWVIDNLQREDIENYEHVICGEEAAHVCSEEELSMPMMTLPEAPEDEQTDKPSDHDDDDDEDDDHPGEEEPTYSLEEKEAMRKALEDEKHPKHDEESDEGKEWVPVKEEDLDIHLGDHVKDEL